MRRGTSVTFDGKEYGSIADLARAYGLPVASVFQRIKKGWSVAQALLIDTPNRRTSGHSIVVGGVTYPSVRKASEAHGLDYKTVHMRMVAGRPVEEVFGLKEFDYASKPKTVVINGIAFSSLRDACRHFGVDKDVLSARVNRYGWTIEQALEVVPRPGHDRGCAGYVYLVRHRASGKPYVGVTMGSIEERWQQHVERAFSDKRLSTRGLHFAMRTEGVEAFSVELLHKAKSHGELCESEAQYIASHNARYPTGFNLNGGGGGARTKGRSVAVEGKRYPSITAACRHFEVERRQVNQRLNSGWSMEEALGLVVRENYQGPKVLEIRGVTYKSIAQAALAFGVSGNSFSQRLRDGWTTEEALGIQERALDRSFVFRGQTFRSESQLCRAFGVKRSTFTSRKRSGLRLEACLGLESSPALDGAGLP